MKPRLNLNHLFLISLFSALLVVSCQKENSLNGSDEEQQIEASRVSSESDGEAELVFNGLFDDIIGVNAEVGIGGVGIFGRGLTCPEVTITHLNSTANFPIRVVINFGTTGCVGNDGHLRRGKIIAEYTNRLIYPGAVSSTVFENFYLDSFKVEGRHTITNITPTNVQPLGRKFEVKVQEAKFTWPNGNYTLWNSTHTITQFEGLATLALALDDQFKIEGSANGKTRRGNLIAEWQSTITEPLIKRFNCRWIVKGIVRTVRNSTNANSPWVAELNFGNGDCDRLAVIVINGTSHQITLR